jgi:MYXO-CTERM domain-containing protein
MRLSSRIFRTQWSARRAGIGVGRGAAAIVTVGLALAAGTIASPAAAAGTWTQAPVNPTNGGGAFGLWLLTDGTILSHGNALNHWIILTPDKKGNYATGTWKSVAASTHARSGATQHMLKDGRFFQAGGEFIDGPACTAALCNTAEIYDPVANTWTDVASAPFDIGDTGSANLADGRLLYSTRNGAGIAIYDPTTDKWTTQANSVLGTGDENAWAALQNGGVLAVGFNTAGAAIYNPATSTWKRTGAVPSGFRTGDTAGISQMFDGRVLVYGFGQTYIYTPGPTAADPGTWALGPAMLNGDEAEDEYTDTLPNGHVFAGLTAVMFGPGVILQDFDPTTNTVSSATPPPDRGNPYPIDYVNLPNGQVMITAGNNDWLYTPDTGPQDAWRPTVSSVVFNSGTTYTLTGTQISGLINGADEGDDMTMAENYPIVYLKDASGNVYFCRSFNFSNMNPSAGPAPETCQFTTPAGLPNGSYDLYVSAVGVQSKNPFPFTVGVGGTSDGGTSTGGSDAGTGADASLGDAGGSGADASSGGSGSNSGGSNTGTSGGTTGGQTNGGTGSIGTSTSHGSGTQSGASGSGGGGNTGGENQPGCGCRTAGQSTAGGGLGALLGLGALIGLGRRRRRSA